MDLLCCESNTKIPVCVSFNVKNESSFETEVAAGDQSHSLCKTIFRECVFSKCEMEYAMACNINKSALENVSASQDAVL